jgi:hypothetical protein
MSEQAVLEEKLGTLHISVPFGQVELDSEPTANVVEHIVACENVFVLQLSQHELHTAFHERIVFSVSHYAPVNLIVWYVKETFQNHYGRYEEYFLVERKAQVCRAIFQIVQYVVLTDLIGANAMYGHTVLGVRSTSTLP